MHITDSGGDTSGQICAMRSEREDNGLWLGRNSDGICTVSQARGDTLQSRVHLMPSEFVGRVLLRDTL